jgi:hypothetical protein
MPLETYLIYLAAVGAFFATPPDGGHRSAAA